MSSDPNRQPTEEEMRAALEQQLDKVPISEVIVQVAVDLLNLAARRAGLGPQGPAGGAPPDMEQASLGIEAVRGLLALVEDKHGPQIGPLKDALSQLQMHYARAAGAAAQGAGAADRDPGDADAPPPPPPAKPGEAGPAQKSGKLWVPGQ